MADAVDAALGVAAAAGRFAEADLLSIVEPDLAVCVETRRSPCR